MRRVASAQQKRKNRTRRNADASPTFHQPSLALPGPRRRRLGSVGAVSFARRECGLVGSGFQRACGQGNLPEIIIGREAEPVPSVFGAARRDEVAIRHRRKTLAHPPSQCHPADFPRCRIEAIIGRGPSNQGVDRRGSLRHAYRIRISFAASLVRRKRPGVASDARRDRPARRPGVAGSRFARRHGR
jgi:hypothetical protein